MTTKLKLSREQMEARRFLAGQLFEQGKGVREVARLLEVAPASASRWKAAFEQGGQEALKAKKHPGREPRLGRGQKKRLVKILRRGSRKAGYANEYWTCPRVAEVIQRRFRVSYHPHSVWHLLRQLNWTCQKPELKAKERGDEKAIQQWRKHDWPRIKRGLGVS